MNTHTHLHRPQTENHKITWSELLQKQLAFGYQSAAPAYILFKGRLPVHKL
jgi:hypothetical protein